MHKPCEAKKEISATTKRERRISINVPDYLYNENTRQKYEEKQPVPYEDSVPFLQATMFACILEDSLTQLRILAECNNELRIMKTTTDMGQLRAAKFHVKQDNKSEDLEKINHKDLGSNEHKLNKLFADRKYIGDVMQQTYLDMALHRCFNALTASIKTREDRYAYQAKLTEEESNNKMARRELSRHLRQQRNHIKSVIYDTNLTMEKLKCEVEDTELNSEIRSRFVENWQRARSEQHTQSIFYKELGPTDSIQYFQTRSDQEHRVHSEVELLVNIFINETLAKVENWMNKFDTDMEAQDLNIAKMKIMYDDAKQKRVALEETYDDHVALVENWLQFKAERKAANDYKEKMMNSALIVQAWWRGLLVRLQMGPYKPTKRPRTAPVEDKKKKKNK